jgi:hypothetical protein
MRCVECLKFRCQDSYRRIGRDIYYEGKKITYLENSVVRCPVLKSIVEGTDKKEALKLIEDKVKV